MNVRMIILIFKEKEYRRITVVTKKKKPVINTKGTTSKTQSLHLLKEDTRRIRHIIW